MVPVMIHGDGAEMYRDTEYFCWSWSSAFGVSSTLKDVYLSKYPIAVVAEREMLSDTAPWCFKFEHFDALKIFVQLSEPM